MYDILCYWGLFRMNKSRRCVIFLLAVIFSVVTATCAASAVFDKTALSSGIFQLNVVHTVTMDSIDDNVYTVWTSAMCFAAGKTADGTAYLVTDAALAEPDRVYAQLGDQLIEFLKEGGIFIDQSELSKYAVITSTAYYVVYNGANIPLAVVSQSASDKLLFLTPSDASYDLSAASFTYAYADLLQENEAVYTFALSGSEIDGVVSATQDAYVTNWSLATQEARVQYPASIEDGNNALTYYTMAPNRGAQGGALFDANGYLVGINLWTDAYNGTTALTSYALMAALNQLGVSYEVYESGSNNFSFSDIFVYVVILGSAILVLIILLVILRIRKNKLDLDDVSDLEREASRAREDMEAQRSQRTPQSAQKRVDARPAANGRASSYSVSIPPVASAPAVPQRQTAQQAVLPKNVSIVVQNGRLKGTVIPVSDKVIIGRDPASCNVVFPADTMEVSRRHCCVSFNRQTGRVLLEDFSSANGTYFPSGTRIIPGRLYSLRSGDRFYLGLPDNMMEVRIEYPQNQG